VSRYCTLDVQRPVDEIDEPWAKTDVRPRPSVHHFMRRE
jgi:hypothetical protein